MDKICIVKRRKRIGELGYQEGAPIEGKPIAQPELASVSCAFINSASGIRIQDSMPSAMPGNIDQKVSLQLNPLGHGAFDGNGSLQQVQPCESDVEAVDNEGRYVFNFLFKKVHDVRMLSSKDVCIMLKVSRRFLSQLVKLGKIDSYKLGRLRRFLLDDILTYLGENKDKPAIARTQKMRRLDQRD
jgi:excisionase family DNA binding protein